MPVKRRILKAHEITGPLEIWLPKPPAKRDEMPAARPQPMAPAADLPAADAVALERDAREKGLADGMRAAEEAYRAKIGRLDALSTRLQAEREEFFDRIEPEVVRLAVSIAEKILDQELELRPELVVDMVRSAMKRLRDREQLRVSVNPRDFEQVRSARDDLIGAVDGVRKLDVIEDRRVDAGGCVIESQNGTLDGRIRTQVKEITSALEGVMPEGEGGQGDGHGAVSGGDQED